MNLVRLLHEALSALESEGFDALVVGGVAMAFYVEPRATQDVDLLVLAHRKDEERLKTALITAGARPTAVEMRKLYERPWVRFDVEGRKLDVHLATLPHLEQAVRRAAEVEHEGQRVPVATAEDLVLMKLPGIDD